MKKSEFFNNYTRRNLIKTFGVGSAAAFIPVLGAEAAEGDAPKRVCFFTTPNGISKEVVPTGNQNNFTFKSVLQPLQDHKSHVTYLHGIDQKTFFESGTSNDHPPTVNQLLTAARPIDPGDGKPASSNNWLSSGTSIDQVLGNRIQANNDTKTKFKTITAGVDVNRFAWKQVFSAPRQAVFPENDASKLHDRIFDGVTPGGGPVDPEITKRITKEKSVIDSVKAELDAVLNKVSSEDKYKIEAHLNGIREIETSLDHTATTSSAACSIPQLRANGGSSEDQYRKKGENMMDIITHAFACDQTRVATLQWGNGGARHKFPSKGVNTEHHEMTHKNFNDHYGDRAKVGEWYCERLLHFVEKLASIKEGNGTMLDNTLIVWTSEHSDEGQHGRRNLPYTLVGNLGGALNVGQFYNYSNNKQSHNDVYVSIAHAMGYTDMNKFGIESVSNGPLPGLLA